MDRRSVLHTSPPEGVYEDGEVVHIPVLDDGDPEGRSIPDDAICQRLRFNMLAMIASYVSTRMHGPRIFFTTHMAYDTLTLKP